jgi:uncharacterized membrane protein YidH (DUF202 family)
MKLKKKFERLAARGILTEKELEEIVQESSSSGRHIEEVMLEKGVPKHEILFCLSGYYGLPFIEYSEEIIASYFLTMRLNMENLIRFLWFPLSVRQNRAEAIAYAPDSTAVIEEIKRALKVEHIDFVIALPSDLVRIIEHNFDVNPDFPPPAGRTPLAKVRTFLADRRSMFACYRTSLAKGRTGLAFVRTGISFITIAIVLFRIFGTGYLNILETLLFVAGIFTTIDGLLWYMPARKAGRESIPCGATEPTWGTTVLEVSNIEDKPVFTRTSPVEGADKLRAEWNKLSPVMRRRFLAGDRTDFAEERTVLAGYRTVMARARTGLAFTRTGIAFTGLGIALLRQFHEGPWTAFDIALVLTGAAMIAEGFYWYVPGRRAGKEGFESVKKSGDGMSIWDFVFPPVHVTTGSVNSGNGKLPVRGSHSPGIWATTGLALERTVLAERRNVMARLRTVMARSRTGMAFMRTGMSVSAVGLGLLVYFGTTNVAWMIFNAAMILIGLAFITDGLFWYVPAEHIKKQFPYCFGDMEIPLPDYGKPARYWGKAVFNHEN